MEHMGPYLQSFLPFAQKRLGFNKPPNIFFDSDAENAQQVLGKTGYYDPDALEIVIFVDNRHPKDVLRSLSHELVHHAQNCRGDLNPEVAGETELGYAQNNTHMRGMESEAYEKGNLCMRDWEDSVKLQLQETNYIHTKGDNHKMATYEELKERITKSVVQKMLERKKRDEPRNDRGIPQRLKEDEEETIDTLGEEEEIEERKKRDNPRNDRGIPQRLKVSEAEAQRKPGSNPWQDQLDKEDAEEAEEDAEAQRAKTAGGKARQRARDRGQARGVSISGVTSEEKAKKENLDEWYQRELYEKLIARWTH